MAVSVGSGVGEVLAAGAAGAGVAVASVAGAAALVVFVADAAGAAAGSVVPPQAVRSADRIMNIRVNRLNLRFTGISSRLLVLSLIGYSVLLDSCGTLQILRCNRHSPY
jgi:hypothetical protein